MPAEHDNIEIRSEEVQEILSQAPAWLIRWGITVVFAIVLNIIALSWIMEYPDIIPGSVTLVTEEPPKHMFSRASGDINLLFENDQEVKEGDVLAVLENAANYQDVLALNKKMTLYHDIIYAEDFNPFNIELDNSYDLGTIQQQFGAFYASVQNATRIQKMAADQERVKSARQRLSSLKKLRANLMVRDSFSIMDMDISETIRSKDNIEIENRWIDSTSFLRGRKEFIAVKQGYNALQSQILQNETDIDAAENSLRELLFNNQDDGDLLKNRVKESFELLESSIMAWKEIYLFESPINGKVALSKYWSDNQFIAAGEELLAVVPHDNVIIGKLALPARGSGKVKEGQKVNIKLDNYPSTEYGMLVGKIKSIALIPRENIYSVSITVPQNMVTSYNKKLEFKQEMIGEASIITEDKKLFERIFNQLREILNKTS